MESALQRKMTAKFEKYGWVVIRLNAGEAFSRNGDRIKLAPPGSPDIEVILPDGQVKFIEFKSTHGTVSDSQAAKHAHLELLGHQVLVARTEREVDLAFARYLRPGKEAVKAARETAPKKLPGTRLPKGYVRLDDWLEEGA